MLLPLLRWLLRCWVLVCVRSQSLGQTQFDLFPDGCWRFWAPLTTKAVLAQWLPFVVLSFQTFYPTALVWVAMPQYPHCFRKMFY